VTRVVAGDLARLGWVRFPHDRAVARWAEAALGAARQVVADPAMAHWHQCEGTWFVGVDALPNRRDGSIAGVPLSGPWEALTGPMPPLHPAQLSVIYPGYPRPRDGEGEAAFRYRARRDGAHLDGLLPEGAERRRHLREPHAWILGLPLTDTQPGAAPMVVWEGSHAILRDTFARAFDGHAPEDWGEIDVTDAYQAARRRIFETCRRVEIHAGPGEAYLVHRLALHGVAPWAEGLPANPDGRMIAYFRPLLPDPEPWLRAP